MKDYNLKNSHVESYVYKIKKISIVYCIDMVLEIPKFLRRFSLKLKSAIIY